MVDNKETIGLLNEISLVLAKKGLDGPSRRVRAHALRLEADDVEGSQQRTSEWTVDERCGGPYIQFCKGMWRVNWVHDKRPVRPAVWRAGALCATVKRFRPWKALL